MSATAITVGDDANSPNFIHRLAMGQVEKWIEACEKITLYHRQHFLLSEPTIDDLKELRRYLPMILTTTRMLNNRAHEPQWPNPEQARMLEAYVWQLEQVELSINNPMTEAEADKIIAAHFPG